jgi:tetratricopeptide (TPR) repeat protein
MKRSVMMIAALTFVLALFTPLTSAHANVSHPAAQDPKAEEAAVYKAWYDANQTATTSKSPDDYRAAMALAKDYLSKYPSGQYAPYLKDKWIPQVLGFLFNEEMKKKNTAGMLEIANEALAVNPDNLDYIYLVAVNLRANELFANPPNYSHAAEAADFTQRAIRLIEAGKKPSGVQQWKQNEALAYLYQTLAAIEEKNKNMDKALEYHAKAGTLEPTNPAHFLACGRIHQDRYLKAVEDYQKVPEADKTAPDPKPEVKAALENVNKTADAVIDCWARFLGMTATKNDFGALRDQVNKALVDLYKYRHPESPDGLQKLIDYYRSGATTPPPAAPAPTKPNEGASAQTSAPPAGTNVAAANTTVAAPGTATKAAAAPEKKPVKKAARRRR